MTLHRNSRGENGNMPMYSGEVTRARLADVLRMGVTLAVAVLLVVLLLANVRLYTRPSPYDAEGAGKNEKIVGQLHYVRHALGAGAADRMQTIFPEGYFFLHVVYGLTWAELGLTGSSPMKEHALQEARFALTALESEKGYGIFDRDLKPAYGVFYTAWKNYLRARIIALSGIHDDSLADAFREEMNILAELYDSSSVPYLESYRNMCWPGDNIVAMYDLYLYDQLFGPEFTETIAAWLKKTKDNPDTATKMFPFELVSEENRIVANARASSQSLILRLLAEISPDYAREQYGLFKKEFLTWRLGVPLVREYPDGVNAKGDYDSGPVIWGIGATATIVSLGTLRTFGDTMIANALEQGIEMLGFPASYDSSRVYAFGMMPVGDVFLAWSKIARPVLSLPADERERVGSGWRLVFHGCSLFVVLMAGFGIVMVWRKRPAETEAGASC